jgi:glycosyltransferase involved in cell wall biosynthesis
MRLSVLIPTISARDSTLSRALWFLQNQTRDLGEFEVLVHRGDHLGKGAKVNAMVDACEGDHIIVLDDDDFLPQHYMDIVLPTLNPDLHGQVDFVGYRILALKDGKFWLSIAHDARNQFGNPTLDRGVCDKMPIRTEVARQVRYGDEYTDDWPWSEAVHNLVESSAFIDEHLYYYDWWPESMAFKNNALETGDWSPQQNVGVWPYDPERVVWL